MNKEELDRLRVFANCVMSSPDQIRQHGKIARGKGNLWNGYGPGLPGPQLEEAFQFIEDFVRLNPDKFLVEKLSDDGLLGIAEVMRIVAEDYENMSCSQAGDMFVPHIEAAKALRGAALRQREANGYSREEWEDEYPERD